MLQVHLIKNLNTKKQITIINKMHKERKFSQSDLHNTMSDLLWVYETRMEYYDSYPRSLNDQNIFNRLQDFIDYFGEVGGVNQIEEPEFNLKELLGFVTLHYSKYDDLLERGQHKSTVILLRSQVNVVRKDFSLVFRDLIQLLRNRWELDSIIIGSIDPIKMGQSNS